MKTLVCNMHQYSMFLLDDDKAVNIGSDRVVIGDPEELIIADRNTENVTLYESVTAPEDWEPYKYFYDGTTWTLNPDWVDPREG